MCVIGYLGTDVPTDYTEQDSPYMCLACGRAQAIGNTRAANTASNMENGALVVHAMRSYLFAYVRTGFA